MTEIKIPPRKGFTELERVLSIRHTKKRGWHLWIERRGNRVGGMAIPLDKISARLLITELARIVDLRETRLLEELRCPRELPHCDGCQCSEDVYFRPCDCGICWAQELDTERRN